MYQVSRYLAVRYLLIVDCKGQQDPSQAYNVIGELVLVEPVIGQRAQEVELDLCIREQSDVVSVAQKST